MYIIIYNIFLFKKIVHCKLSADKLHLPKTHKTTSYLFHFVPPYDQTPHFSLFGTYLLYKQKIKKNRRNRYACAPGDLSYFTNLQFSVCACAMFTTGIPSGSSSRLYSSYFVSVSAKTNTLSSFLPSSARRTIFAILETQLRDLRLRIRSSGLSVYFIEIASDRFLLSSIMRRNCIAPRSIFIIIFLLMFELRISIICFTNFRKRKKIKNTHLSPVKVFTKRRAFRTEPTNIPEQTSGVRTFSHAGCFSYRFTSSKWPLTVRGTTWNNIPFSS